MTATFLRHVLCAAALALAGLSAGTAAQSTHPPEHPALVVKTFSGKTFDLANERGKWVIVNFWATWCSPCLEEMPAISKFVATHRDVTAIGLDWQPESLEEVLAYVRKHPVDYPLAKVPYERQPGGFASPLGLPESYLVAPDGTVAKHFLGPLTAKSLAAAIAMASRRPVAAKR